MTRTVDPYRYLDNLPCIRRVEPAWLPLDSDNAHNQIGAAPGNLVQPGARACIQYTSYRDGVFKAERLFVRRQCASDFLIRSIFVGPTYGRPTVNDEPLIAEPFAVDFDDLPFLEMSRVAAGTPVAVRVDRKSADLLGAPMPLPELHQGMHLTVEIESIGERPLRFLGALFGQLKC